MHGKGRTGNAFFSYVSLSMKLLQVDFTISACRKCLSKHVSGVMDVCAAFLVLKFYINIERKIHKKIHKYTFELLEATKMKK